MLVVILSSNRGVNYSLLFSAQNNNQKIGQQMHKAIVTSLVLFITASYSQTTAFFTTGASTGWITHGVTELLTADTASFYPHKEYYSPTSTNQAIGFGISSNSTIYKVEISAPYGTTFQTGTTYEATRFPFNSYPNAGLDFSKDSHGNNQLFGAFTVYDFVTAADGRLMSAAIDFILFEELDVNNWIFGSLRYYSSVPLTTDISAIPEPSTYAAIAGAAMLGIATVAKRRKHINSAKPTV